MTLTPQHLTPPYDLILFDLDGTLSDPLVGVGRSINYALTHFGFAPRTLQELAIYIGPPLDESFKALTALDSPADIDALVAKYRERYGDIGYAENEIYPGIPEAIAALSQAGVPLAVCTSKRTDFAEKILDMFALRQYFRFVSGGEAGLQKWQQMQVLVAQGQVTTSAVMVGDRAFDMIAAHRNGLHAAGVLWGHGSREELQGENPQYLFANTAELVSLCPTPTSAAW